MGKRFAIIFSTLLVFIFPISIFAQNNFRSSQMVTLSKDEVINTDYFAAGESVFLDGTVNGDAYLAGGNINVDGNVKGDLMVAGGNINIRGNIEGNIRSAGGSTNISGNVGKNITTMGGSINYLEGAKITGSIVGAGGNINIYTPISKDVHLAAGNATLDNKITGTLNATVGELNLTPRGSIDGDLNYWSQNQARISPQATVSGKINQYQPPAQKKDLTKPAGEAFRSALTFYNIISFLSSLLIGLILLRFLPNITRAIATNLNNKPWASLGLGFLVAIALPVIFVLLIITLIGIPLALVILMLFLLAMYFTKIFVGLLVGQKIMKLLNQSWNIYLQFIIGFLTLALISQIPILGGIISMLVILFGLGALLITKKEYYLNLRNKKIL